MAEFFTPAQLERLTRQTPTEVIQQRTDENGKEWDFVTGSYIKSELNTLFDYNWSFDVISKEIIHGEVVVLGKLTVTSGEATIHKTQAGNKAIEYTKDGNTPASIGWDTKAAITDCLKKCASELGICSDIYNQIEFKELPPVKESKNKIKANKAMESLKNQLKK